jgi:hypothetical protein
MLAKSRQHASKEQKAYGGGGRRSCVTTPVHKGSFSLVEDKFWSIFWWKMSPFTSNVPNISV